MNECIGTDRMSGYVIECECFEMWYTRSRATPLKI